MNRERALKVVFGVGRIAVFGSHGSVDDVCAERTWVGDDA